MSQKKVDEYKEYKKNRKEILAKEKKAKQRNKVLAIIATVAIIGGVGYGVFYTYKTETAPDITFAELVAPDQYGLLVPTIED